ncbi:MAG: carbohydrate ABC transporter permease [Erysipelotrichaceae bacterium]|nr:carbohydrate ABC transporter permease [Erysipelotrichaceae bacterium]
MRRRYLFSKVFIWMAAAAAVFPVLFILANSFMSGGEILSRYSAEVMPSNAGDFISHNIHFVRFGLIPEQPTLEQYALLLKSSGYMRMFWNSVLLVVPVLLGQCILAPLAAYGFENIRWKYKEAVYFIYIVVMLMPTQITMVPNFIVAGWLNIRDSYLAIILPAIFHPLGVFLVRQQLKNFPRECMEAAAVDGAGPWQVYRRIVRPNLNSVVAAMLVLLFADNWNIIDQAVVFIKGIYRNPLSVYLGNVAGEDPGMFFAVSVFYLIPALLVFLLGQDYLTEGITLSGIKA